MKTTVRFYMSNGNDFKFTMPVEKEEAKKWLAEMLCFQQKDNFILLTGEENKERIVNKQYIVQIDFKEVCDSHDDKSRLVWTDDGWHCKQCGENFI